MATPTPSTEPTPVPGRTIPAAENIAVSLAAAYPSWDWDNLFLLSIEQGAWESSGAECTGADGAGVTIPTGWEVRVLQLGPAGQSAVGKLRMREDLTTVSICPMGNDDMAFRYPIRASRVLDGDTLSAAPTWGSAKTFRVRLLDIDAHESCTEPGRWATGFAKDWVARAGDGLHVVILDVDQYGRVLGYVVDESTLSLNEALLLGGFAFVYGDLSTPLGLYQMEAEARERRHGVWSTSDSSAVEVNGFVRPWDWRKVLTCKDGQVVHR